MCGRFRQRSKGTGGIGRDLVTEGCYRDTFFLEKSGATSALRESGSDPFQRMTLIRLNPYVRVGSFFTSSYPTMLGYKNSLDFPTSDK